MSNSGLGRNFHSLILSIQHIPLPTKASPTPKGAPKDGFEESVMECDIPQPCKVFDSCKKRFLRTYRKVDL